MKCSWLTALPCLLIVVGCNRGATVVGRWKVAPEVASSNPAGLPTGFMTGFSGTFKYNFKADKTFEGSMTSGTYTFEDGKLTMTTTKMGATALPKPQQVMGELSDDGKTLTLHPPDLAKLAKMLGKLNFDALKNIKMVREE